MVKVNRRSSTFVSAYLDDFAVHHCVCGFVIGNRPSFGSPQCSLPAHCHSRLPNAFALSTRTNFNDKEAASIYYGIMAVAHKMELSLGTKEGISSAVNNFLSGMSWRDCSKFNVECVTNWTHLFAERDVTYEPSIIDNFISFVDYMSCNAETYTSLCGSNGCADQLTNWDGTKKLGLESVTKKKGRTY